VRRPQHDPKRDPGDRRGELHPPFLRGTSIAIEREFETKITDLPKMLGDDPNVTMTARLVKLCMRKTARC